MRLGIIGAGAVAGLHAQGADDIAGLSLAAVCDLKADAAAKVAEPWGAAVYTDYRQMLAAGVVDAVVINTPHSLHKEMVLAAAAHGVHVLVEKPVATTLEDARTMEDACAAAGVVMVVGMIQHFMAEKLALRTALDAGRLGRVLMVHDYRSTDYRPGSRPDWFFDKAVSGGGAFINIGAHCLDRSLWLGGAPAARITATVLNRFGSPVETDGTMELLLENGVQLRITIASDCPNNIDEMLVVGELGTATVDPRRGTFMEIDGERTVLHTTSPHDIQNAFTAQLADFKAAVGGAAPAVSLAHASHVVELVLAAYAAAETGTAVELAPVPVP
ncbi:putative dehydrogenase [Arthrobacter stackebrandtii]|uniref:Dehydrogenase n=1 Tax=Arthrobacter stackebrandtii TaxID=272161 RepID=A0ABS4YT12_9MICC|nr:Gfo/Idh/MocA family oxidoreductase [Arthrobacter stackebrandtii]MBP2411916.1 putative dehydrogenase [Arthrobacter stackebrandtii]PYG99820.1 gfo/Idh/MocA family oxidoreductase [Arthrobacter stackebrandtii]